MSAALAVVLASAGLATASAQSWESTVSGELLEVVVETEGAPTEERVVISEDGEVSSVDGAAIEQITPGATVEVELAGSEVQSAEVVAPAAETVAISTHRAYVVTIDDPSVSGDVTLANAVSNTQYAAGYWVREARGAIASFDVAASTTLTWSGSCAANYSQLWTAAAAEFPTVNFSGAGNHLIVYTPSACAYGYAGVATVGSMPAGGYVHISSLGPSTTVHELGHNLGLGHSNALWGDPYGSYGFAEYYGVYGPQAGSVGSLQPGGLDAAYRFFLDLPGWEGTTQTLTADPDLRETYTVTLNETTANSGTTGIMIEDPSDGSRYFLDLRSAQGVDASTFYALSYSKLSVQGLLADYSPGVVVTWMPTGRDVEILGQVQGTDLWTSLQAGDGYTAPDGLFQVTVLSSTTAAATVEVVTSPAAPAELPSTTSLDVPTVYEGVAPQATVTVTADEVPTGDVDLYVDGVWHSATSLESGRAVVDLPDNLAVGDHQIRAVYSGAGVIVGSEAVATATVVPWATPTVTAFARPAWYGVPVLVTVSVLGADVTGGEVVISYGGSSWRATLGGTGVAQVSMPSNWSVGARTLSVTFLGTEGVHPAQTTVVAHTMQLTSPVVLTSASASGARQLIADAAPTSGAVAEPVDQSPETSADVAIASTEEAFVGEPAHASAIALTAYSGDDAAPSWRGDGRLSLHDGYTMRFLIR